MMTSGTKEVHTGGGTFVGCIKLKSNVAHHWRQASDVCSVREPESRRPVDEPSWPTYQFSLKIPLTISNGDWFTVAMAPPRNSRDKLCSGSHCGLTMMRQ